MSITTHLLKQHEDFVKLLKFYKYKKSAFGGSKFINIKNQHLEVPRFINIKDSFMEKLVYKYKTDLIQVYRNKTLYNQ